MRIVVVGGTGHIGTYLVPRLVGRNFEVISISRGHRQPYRQHHSWRHVRQVVADRTAEDERGRFAARLVDLRPDVVLDLQCFTGASAQQLVEVPRGRLGLVVSAGSAWVYGSAVEVPVREDAARQPKGAYGAGKVAAERVLLEAAARRRLQAVVLHPGHITGPGWAPINPAGNVDLAIWDRVASGGRVVLPNLGLETLHHVHAADVAHAFEQVLLRPDAALGHSFNITSPAALTLVGLATAAADWYGATPHLEFLPWPKFAREVGPELAATSFEHISQSPAMSIEKARRLIGYEPRYSSLRAVRCALLQLHSQGLLQAKPPGRTTSDDPSDDSSAECE